MITLAQIGVGDWGRNHLRNYMDIPGCKMKLCCDRDRKVLDGIGAAYGNKLGLTTDVQRVFSDKGIDAVVIATLPDTHAVLAIEAMKNGKDVFIEKPLAMSVREGLAIKKAALQYKKVCMVGHILLYHPAIRKMKEYIDSGQFGSMYYMYSTRVNLGKIREEENALWSLTSHDISVIMYIMGDLPRHVSAVGSPYLRDDIDDVVFVNLSFGNKVIAHIHASWLDPHKIRQFTVVGSKKMAVFDDMAPSGKLKIYDKGACLTDGNGPVKLRSGETLVPEVYDVEPLKIECLEFIDCVKNRKTPLAGVDNGIEVLRILEAAQESLDKKGIAIKL